MCIKHRIAKFPFFENFFLVSQGYSCIICILLLWQFTTCVELCFTSGTTRSPPFKLFSYANNNFFVIQEFKPLRKFKRDFLKSPCPDVNLQNFFLLTFSICVECQFCLKALNLYTFPLKLERTKLVVIKPQFGSTEKALFTYFVSLEFANEIRIEQFLV